MLSGNNKEKCKHEKDLCGGVVVRPREKDHSYHLLPWKVSVKIG